MENKPLEITDVDYRRRMADRTILARIAEAARIMR